MLLLSRQILFDYVDRNQILVHLILYILLRHGGICCIKIKIRFIFRAAFMDKIYIQATYRFGIIFKPVSVPVLLCAFDWAAVLGMFGDVFSK